MRDDVSTAVGPMSRRSFLAGSTAALTLLAGSDEAQSKTPRDAFEVVRLRQGRLTGAESSAVLAFQAQLKLRTSITVAPSSPAMTPDDSRLRVRPFALLRGTRDFSFSTVQRARLKRWLELGGFLLVDNAGTSAPAAPFDKAVRREITAMFPRKRLARVSPEHVLYRSFYRLDYPAGRVIHRPHVEGLALGRRFGVILNHNDLFGAFARDAAGRYLSIPRPGGETQREMAYRFAINLVMYAMCLHYKDDQVHLDYLLHRRKWKVRPPR